MCGALVRCHDPRGVHHRPAEALEPFGESPSPATPDRIRTHGAAMPGQAEAVITSRAAWARHDGAARAPGRGRRSPRPRKYPRSHIYWTRSGPRWCTSWLAEGGIPPGPGPASSLLDPLRDHALVGICGDAQLGRGPRSRLIESTEHIWASAESGRRATGALERAAEVLAGGIPSRRPERSWPWPGLRSVRGGHAVIRRGGTQHCGCYLRRGSGRRDHVPGLAAATVSVAGNRTSARGYLLGRHGRAVGPGGHHVFRRDRCRLSEHLGGGRHQGALPLGAAVRPSPGSATA
jgi:hypothetical protein